MKPDYVDFGHMEIDTVYELNHECHPQWNQAKQDELQSLIVLHSTWEVIRCPDGKKPITFKWVVKEKPDNLKARLTARSFSQQFWIYYNETLHQFQN